MSATKNVQQLNEELQQLNTELQATSEKVAALEKELIGIKSMIPAPKPKPEPPTPAPPMSELLKANKEAGESIKKNEIIVAMGKVKSMVNDIPDEYKVM